MTDVLGEIRRQIGSIERQAKKAARYKRLRETSRVVELSLAIEDRAELVSEIENSDARHRALLDQITALETNLSERELAVENKRIELTEAEKVLSMGSEQLVALRSDIKELEGRIEYARRERETLAETAEVRRHELAQLREQLTVQEREAAASEDELRSVEAALASEREQVVAAEGEATA